MGLRLSRPRHHKPDGRYVDDYDPERQPTNEELQEHPELRTTNIFFDPDEAMLRMTAEFPLVGADRIIWASDYPHPDTKIPGVTEELTEALDGLSFDEKRQITSESALALYAIG